MKIVLFHPSLLPPRDYGGVERVVLWLAKGLVEAGHEVWVAAYAGSSLPRGAHLLEMDTKDPSAHALLPRLQRLFPSGPDVVHFMATPEPGVLEALPCAGVVTVHGNGKPDEVFPRNTVFLSADHAKRHGGQVFVHNGIDPEELQFDPRRERPAFLFFSKTSWRVKNLRGAVRFCRQAGAKLEVAGGNRPISTRLQVSLTPGMRWLGPLGGERKADALARARALVFPVLWPEPFGLVVVEALMSGAPVIASRLGSLPELVGPDVGVLLSPDDAPSWIEWLRRDRLPWDAETCRNWALQRFHYQKMTEGYLEVYRKVTAGQSLHLKEIRRP